MNRIQTETGFRPILNSKTVGLSLSMFLVLGFSGGAALADSASATTQQSTITEPAKSTTKESVTIHKGKATAESAPAANSKDFWRRLAQNRKVSLMASDLTVPTDMIESPTDIKIFAEVPGIDDKSLDVSVLKDTVTIKGEKMIDIAQKPEDFRRLERAYGKFEKSIALPSSVDSDNSTATLKDGILTLTFPKIATAQNEGKKLAIRHE